MQNQTDNNFLYFAQEGKLKSLKKMINEDDYEPSNEIKHQALYLSLNSQKMNTLKYICSIFESHTNIDVFYKEGLLIKTAMVIPDVEISLRFFYETCFLLNDDVHFFKNYFIEILKKSKYEGSLKTLFDITMLSGLGTYLGDNISNILLEESDNFLKRKQILDFLKLEKSIEDF